MGLNRLTRKALAFNEKTVKQLPQIKEELDWILFEFFESLGDLMYEDRKENNNRYPFYEKNVKVGSILINMNNISSYKMPQDKEKYLSEFYGMLTMVEQLEYRMKLFKKNVNKIIRKLDKD